MAGEDRVFHMARLWVDKHMVQKADAVSKFCFEVQYNILVTAPSIGIRVARAFHLNSGANGKV